MKKRLWNFRYLLLLLLQIIALKIISSLPQEVETLYSQTIYPLVSEVLRLTFGKIPFSLGDILYFGFGGFLLFNFWKSFQMKRLSFENIVLNISFYVCLFYFLFHFLWGIQYHRISFHQYFESKQTYTCEELEEFTVQLIAKTNELHIQIMGHDTITYRNPYQVSEIFEKAIVSYEEISIKYPFLKYENPSIKESLFSKPLSYMGFSGYFNPFTHEAQVNSFIPRYNFPTTTLHEMAHQIGIAPENEANFIGYLVSIESSDIHFRYSGYTFGLKYCLRNMERLSPGRLSYLLQKINPGIVANFMETEKFHAAHESPLEWVSKHFYDYFLKANKQQDGIMGYNNFVAAMVSYGM